MEWYVAVLLITSILAALYAYSAFWLPTIEHMYPFDNEGYLHPESQVVVEGPLTSKSILEEAPEKYYLNLENQRCKHITNAPDFWKHYRFLNHPTNEHACYFKLSDTLVGGGDSCNSSNALLSSAVHAGTVTSVKPDLVNDAYTAKALKNNACVVQFAPGADTARKNAYASFLDDNDPKVNALHQDIRKLNLANEALQILKKKLHGQMQDLMTKSGEQERLLAEKQALLENKARGVSDVELRISAKKKELEDKKNAVGALIAKAKAADEARLASQGWS